MILEIIHLTFLGSLISFAPNIFEKKIGM